MADLQKLVEELSSLTVMEAAELKKMLEEAWGVEAAAPMAMGAIFDGPFLRVTPMMTIRKNAVSTASMMNTDESDAFNIESSP